MRVHGQSRGLRDGMNNYTDSIHIHRVFRQCKARCESCDEPLVSEPFACNRVHEGIEPFRGMPRNVAFIQTKRKLIDVATEMLFADLMVDTVQSAFQDCPNTLDAVFGSHPAHVFARRMV